MGIVTGALNIFIAAVKKIFSVIIDFAAKTIIYFGLYIPLFWFITGCIFTLFNIWNADIFTAGAPFFDLFWAIFVFCCIISAGITINHIFVKPIKYFFGTEKEPDEEMINKSGLSEEYCEYETARKFKNRDNAAHEDFYPEIKAERKKDFKVLKSSKYPDIIIHDYPEYRVYFKYIEGRLTLLEKRYKK